MGKIYSRAVKHKKPLVGVTGIIGSGKTTISLLFAELGASIFDADDAARKATEDKNVIQKISATFGDQVFDADHNLDRRKLANLVFNDRDQLARLNNIVHPIVREKMWHFIEDQQQKKNVPMIMIDAPLIYETDLHTFMDYVVVVFSSEEVVINRVQNRDGLSREEILERLSRQIPIEEKVTRADFTVDNSEEIQNSKKEVRKIFDNILKKWKTDAD